MKSKMINLIPLGIVLIIIGFVIIIIGALTSGDKNSDAKVAAVGFIGFIPFGFSNDKQTLYWTIALSIIVFIIWIWFFKFR